MPESPQILKIPMPDSVYDELDEAFIEENESSHDFIWGLIRKLCKDAKVGRINKICSVNVIKDGQAAIDQVKLRGTKLDEVPNNKDWIPENIEKDEVKYFEHKVTDKTMKYLKLFCSFTILRHTKYIDSVHEDNEKKIKNLEEQKADVKLIKDAKAGFENTIKRFKETTPKCFEEILFVALFPSINKKVTDSIDREFDAENAEMYPKEVKPSN